jgi:anti-sigma factor RsiW
MLLLAAGIVAGYVAAGYGAAGRASAIEPWILKVASYHAMYGRETVADGSSAAVQSEVLEQRLRRQGLQLKVPDLSSRGLQFVRAQQLRFDGKMILQLVYLPRQGLPIALCLTPADAQPDRTVTVDGVHAMTWHAGQWAYVLLGGLPWDDMEAVRRELPGALI